MHKKYIGKLIGGVIVIALMSGFVGGYIMRNFVDSNQNENLKRASYYAHEVATLQSPHGLRKALANGTAKDKYVIVDVRSPEEYERDHITTAYNIPAYLTKDNIEHTSEDRIIDDFRKLQNVNTEKEVIIYCYSSSCMTGRKMGDLLARNNIFVKELTIGWNEWRYFPNTWNYPHEWKDVDILDYVTVGKERGEIKAGLAPRGCPIEGGLGC